MSKQDIEELENSLRYYFKDKALLLDAVTHRSFYHENPDTAHSQNERLEFLGDSVLGFVVVEYLFKLEKDYSESTMSKIKSYLVKEAVLFNVAESISLGTHLRLGKGEKETGGRGKKSILADALEAVFGAIYIDGGYERARDVILRLLQDKINAAVSSEQFYDFKTDLQEKSQVMFGVLPRYVTVKQEGEEHKKIFTVEVYIKGDRLGKGSGRSKKEAETAAAKEALSKIKASENP
ncbi:MAG: ribonuclease III [Nitrospirae bacterium CG_4_10_14_3_um_filter_44_29]|nr:ribonuclease III [Nitrospirota bacterium]OIO29113.1 MAG: ribonuclease III [Nitrospirae bacterium CG1_02_44_142]PIV67297.1 MAG: ribonuclease III [Nitrospirae bacterium CG01_land_8_20_14_3_00_44_22]PIW89239.1 MAG: ribonuclease III [Nitrospirae bacterium CG_4_8_14_3_um_filter_44_28]PIX88648.1 MAG: ribonuclease III [Nitrospirae bacterium CG_4_10_14_3_um_filter_44_29]PJA82228.1 MAG: ribonuclease III [Nitrospirae bacterium CG_4_9_14_3_um_filter_44_28]